MLKSYVIGTICRMPTYQYACTKCENEFEVVQSFSDEPIKNCPECNSEVRKKFGAVGVVFKGSGFYRTDSRQKKKTEAKPKKDEKSKDSSKKEPVKTDSKNEKKTPKPKKDS